MKTTKPPLRNLLLGAWAPDQSPWLASQVLGFLVVLLLGVFFLKKKNWILSSGCWVRSWFLATFLLFLASVGFQSGGGKWFSFHRHYMLVDDVILIQAKLVLVNLIS
uniref:Uncharacterized protein n=1 Tax=Zea mays TaxID=4577 RepID=A0A804M0S3_MAIZE